jgi:hypothetical protein
LLSKFEEVKGVKAKRVAIKREKILEENKLYEENPDEEEEDVEVEFEGGDDDDVDDEDEIDSESSGEELIIDEDGFARPKRLFIPRCKAQAYKHAEGRVLKIKKGNPMKFTKGTDPKTMGLLRFLLDDSVACP